MYRVDFRLTTVMHIPYIMVYGMVLVSDLEHIMHGTSEAKICILSIQNSCIYNYRYMMQAVSRSQHMPNCMHIIVQNNKDCL